MHALVAQEEPAKPVAANDHIQIALIGAGGQGMNDTKAAVQVPGVKLVAVADCYNGRLERSKELWGDDIMPVVESALTATLASPPISSDCLCCGNSGRIDFLLTAGHRFGRENLIARARAETETQLSSARRTGSFRLERRGDDLQPGLFRGLSGIGYTLLRVAHPGKVPGILMWE